MSEVILGINAYHADSSACIVVDGKLLFACEEERLRRIKHWAGFPSMSARACLEFAGMSLSDVDFIALNSDPRAAIGRKLLYTLTKRPSMDLLRARLENSRKRQSVRSALTQAFPEEKFSGAIVRIEHHIAHLASAYYCGPFDDAVAISVDGFGDYASAAWGIGSSGRLDLKDRVYFPHSLGIFYQALTQFLGFPNYGDEYKVMGLAPYGEPAFLSEMEQILALRDRGRFELNLDYFRHHRERINNDWSDGIPKFQRLFSDRIIKLLGDPRDPDEPLLQRHRDLARSIQVRYEDAYFHMLEYLQRESGLKNLVVAGGCGANSVANGKIRRRTEFANVYIQPAAGDAGGAVGAALELRRKLHERQTIGHMPHAYWGHEATNEEISAVLARYQKELHSQKCSVCICDTDEELCREVAEAVASGMVVGWFQGRMEWGPRALGNRSIVCDPRRANMKDILNLKIKRREEFRPFAPSVLRDRVADWFEEDDDVPFMMKVFQVREDKRSEVPAVTHVDGSGRLQTVTESYNPLYYRLISEFDRLTGVPIVLNTSFNENEPVVCVPEEALECFLRTKMDVLVLGSHLVVRDSSGREAEISV